MSGTDGWFYDFFIAPSQDKAFEIVKNLIDGDSTILDAGCGTGRFCFQINDKCSKIDGVDASLKNIESANKNYDSNFYHKIKFYFNDIKSFLEESNFKYDYAILSYVIHEIDETKRKDILKLLSLYVDKIIIVDYLSPHPKSFTGIVNRIVEFFAGKVHYKNFKSYLKNDGIKGLAMQSNLKFIIDIKNNPPTSHIAILSNR
ncbi:MAG: class I SAM-dependent methyltransferase [Ignavibacteriae bacterium]|nr:class I SAM-dependent methyltransferase [Ignavibacteriota bacterium]